MGSSGNDDDEPGMMLPVKPPEEPPEKPPEESPETTPEVGESGSKGILKSKSTAQPRSIKRVSWASVLQRFSPDTVRHMGGPKKEKLQKDTRPDPSTTAGKGTLACA